MENESKFVMAKKVHVVSINIIIFNAYPVLMVGLGYLGNPDIMKQDLRVLVELVFPGGKPSYLPPRQAPKITASGHTKQLV